MQRNRVVSGLACLCVLVGVSACGGKDKETKSDVTEQISDVLQSGPDGLTAKQADCYAGIIVDKAGFDALKDLDLSADEPPEELQDEIAAAAVQATDECDLTGAGG